MAHHPDARLGDRAARARPCGPAPSSLTTSAPPSLTNRIALATACSSETSYEPNGRSPTTSGRVARARDRARQEDHLVERHRHRRRRGRASTIAAVSPTRISSTPASSAIRAPGASYAVIITILSPRCFICASSGSGSFPGAGVPAAGVRGRVLLTLLSGGRCRSTCAADSSGDREGRSVQVGHRDVVGLDSCRGEHLARAPGSRVSSARAIALACARSSTSASGCGTRPPTVGVAHRVYDSDLDADVEVAHQLFQTATCCASFRPNHATCGRTMLKSLRQTVATPRKCPVGGRTRDPSPDPRDRPTSRTPVGTSPRPTARTGTSTPWLSANVRVARSRSRG